MSRSLSSTVARHAQFAQDVLTSGVDPNASWKVNSPRFVTSMGTHMLASGPSSQLPIPDFAAEDDLHQSPSSANMACARQLEATTERLQAHTERLQGRTEGLKESVQRLRASTERLRSRTNRLRLECESTPPSLPPPPRNRGR